MPTIPARCSSGSVTRRKWLPYHPRDPVVAGQPLVQERVVGPQQVDGAVVLAELAGEGTARSPRCIAWRRFSSNAGKMVGSGATLRILCSSSPAGRRSCAPARPSADRRALRRTCRSRTAGSDSVPPLGEGEELLVRDAVPEEERQPRRQLDVAYAVDGDVGISRRARHAEQELRIDEHALQQPSGCPRRSRAAPGPTRRSP